VIAITIIAKAINSWPLSLVKNRRIIGYYRVSSSKQKEDDEGVARE